MRRLICVPIVVMLALVPAPAHALTGGLLDPSFGSGGLASVSTAPPGEREFSNAMVVDSLGRVLVGGVLQNNEPSDPNGGWMLVRFRSDGMLDAGFGVSGFAKAPGLFGPNLADKGQEIRALALVPGSDKIIAGGTTPGAAFEVFTVARYNGDGSLDMSFGPADTGFVKADVSASFDNLEDIAVSPEGAITAVGYAGSDTALVRWDSDGVLDPTFDGPGVPGNGMFVDPVTAESDDYRDVELEPSGAVRAVGVSDGNWLIARYTPTGARDLGFNGSGVVITNFSGQSDLGVDQLLVGGTLYVFGSLDADLGPATQRDFGVDAFDADSGTELPGTKTQVSLPGTQNLFAAALQRLGGSPDPSAERFLLVGTGEFGADGGSLLMRLRRVNGSSPTLELDPDFGSGGIVPPPVSDGIWHDVAVDGQNRPVAGGEIGRLTTADFAATRFLEETPAAGDATAPVITRARMTPRIWAVDGRGPAEVRLARRTKQGTTFRFTLSESARVVIRIERRVRGRKVGRKCSRESRRNRKRRRCTRYLRVGSFAHAGRTGANRKRFTGRIGRTRLSPARYRATLIATDPAGNASRPKLLSFRVVRRKQPSNP